MAVAYAEAIGSRVSVPLLSITDLAGNNGTTEIGDDGQVSAWVLQVADRSANTLSGMLYAPDFREDLLERTVSILGHTLPSEGVRALGIADAMLNPEAFFLPTPPTTTTTEPTTTTLESTTTTETTTVAITTTLQQTTSTTTEAASGGVAKDIGGQDVDGGEGDDGTGGDGAQQAGGDAPAKPGSGNEGGGAFWSFVIGAGGSLAAVLAIVYVVRRRSSKGGGAMAAPRRRDNQV